MPFECRYDNAKEVSRIIFNIIFYGKYPGYLSKTFNAVLDNK